MKMQAFNPYLPSYEYIADGEPRVFGDRLYVYGSHDRFNGNDFCVNDYVCWSAPLDDLGKWRFEGVIYKASQDPRNKKGNMHMCAPDVVQGPDGRYYLYYEYHMLTVTSVAVCDTPAGKYEFYGYIKKSDGTPYGEKKGEVNLFDPGVLVDDDGRIYMYSGFSPEPGILKLVMSMRKLKLDGAYCFELEKDMLTIKGEPTMVAPGPDMAKGTSFEGHGFYEASSIRKINDLYYYVYSSVLSHELCYAISKYPNKDFTYGGTIVSIGDIGYLGRTEPDNYLGNTHGGMVEINNQWYIFYHRQTNKQKCARQGCAEKITILPDGSIPQIEMTSCGLNPGPLRGKGVYEARIACTLSSKNGTFPYLKTREKDKKNIHPYFTQSGDDREGDGDQYIANMTDGASAGFKYFLFNKLNRISVTVRGDAEGEVQIRLGNNDSLLARIEICSSSDFVKYDGEVNENVTGTESLCFTYKGKGSIDFKEFELA